MMEEKLTAHGGLALMAEFNHGIGLRELTGQFCCLSLSILPKNLVHEWMIYLKKAPFQGEIVLEVFSPQDLKESLNIVLETPCFE